MECRICQEGTTKILIPANKFEYGYDKCDFCGIQRTLHENVNIGSNFGVRHVNHRFNILGEKIYAINSRMRFIFIKKYLKLKSGKVLDYGCGRGDLLKRFSKYGWEVFGTEYSDSTSKEVRKIFTNIFLRTRSQQETIASFPKNFFNLVTSFHNLEHLDDPFFFVENTRRILKKDGILIIEVPNILSWQSRISKFHWIYLDPQNHTHHFNRKSLTILLEKQDFIIKRIAYFSIGMGTVGMTFSIINFFRHEKNAFFHQMKYSDSLLKLISEGILFVVFLPLGFLLEVLSLLTNSGSVIRIVAVQDK